MNPTAPCRAFRGKNACVSPSIILARCLVGTVKNVVEYDEVFSKNLPTYKTCCIKQLVVQTLVSIGVARGLSPLAARFLKFEPTQIL